MLQILYCRQYFWQKSIIMDTTQAGRRLFLRVSDICQLTGTGKRNAFKILRRIRDAYDKKRGQRVTIFEYAKYEDIDPEEIYQVLLKK